MSKLLSLKLYMLKLFSLDIINSLHKMYKITKLMGIKLLNLELHLLEINSLYEMYKIIKLMNIKLLNLNLHLLEIDNMIIIQIKLYNLHKV